MNHPTVSPRAATANRCTSGDPEIPRNAPETSVAPGFWISVGRRLRLLGPGEALCVVFPPDCGYQPQSRMLLNALQREMPGFRVGHYWSIGGRLYVWPLHVARRQEAA